MALKTDTFPNGVQAAGNNLFILVTTPPANPAAPKLTELDAVTNLDITCYIPTSAFAVGFEQPMEDDTRWCDTSTRETFGLPTLNLAEISHIVNPQGTGSETGNLLLGALLPNSFYHLYWRLGLPQKTALAASQKVVGFSLATGAEIIPPMTSGKYLRTVKTKLTAVTALGGVAISAGTASP